MDTRPQLEREAKSALRACVLLIVGCALLGGAVAAEIVIHYTTPPKELPS